MRKFLCVSKCRVLTASLNTGGRNLDRLLRDQLYPPGPLEHHSLAFRKVFAQRVIWWYGINIDGDANTTVPVVVVDSDVLSLRVKLRDRLPLEAVDARRETKLR